MVPVYLLNEKRGYQICVSQIETASRLSYNLTYGKYLGRAGLNGTLARQTTF